MSCPTSLLFVVIHTEQFLLICSHVTPSTEYPGGRALNNIENHNEPVGYVKSNISLSERPPPPDGEDFGIRSPFASTPTYGDGSHVLMTPAVVDVACGIEITPSSTSILFSIFTMPYYDFDAFGKSSIFMFK